MDKSIRKFDKGSSDPASLQTAIDDLYLLSGKYQKSPEVSPNLLKGLNSDGEDCRMRT
jgi:hypothetical protein